MVKHILKNFSSGPLDRYRKYSSFDWKDMKIFIEGEEIIIYTNDLVNKLKNHLIFYANETKLTVNDEKYLATKRMMQMIKMKLANDVSFDVRKSIVLIKTLLCWDPASSIKYFHTIYNGMTLNALKTLGTERHQKYIEKALEGKILGSFCMTEIGHGSNTKAIRTIATYEPVTQEFILHTPDFQAAKCWVANLGKSSTYGLVYAQLYTPDGKNHGLQVFIVDIRDNKTLLPYPGITLGDMGAKAGLNGIDNGFMMFNHHRVPRENLLSKIGDVTPEGKYVMTLKDPSKRFGIFLKAISSSRIGIIHICATNLAKALTIAVRYAAVKEIFVSNEKLPLLEYQLTQFKLLPNLAACYILNIFSYHYLINIEENPMNDATLIEIHALSSAGKSVAGWITRDAIKDCKDVCGAHGYLKISELSDLANNHEANLTYDGENNVLCQQTSNWLIKCWNAVISGKNVNRAPLESTNFLFDFKNILNSRFSAGNPEEATHPINIIKAYEWLNCYLLQKSHEKLLYLVKLGTNSFTAKNNSQIYFLRTLSIVYFELFIIEKTYAIIQKIADIPIRNILISLLSLYGSWSLDKHFLILYEGGYASGTNPLTMIREGILRLCEKIKPDAVSLVDSIAPNDFFISSPLGASDGQIYKHLENVLTHFPGTFNRVKWWQEIIQNSKL